MAFDPDNFSVKGELVTVLEDVALKLFGVMSFSLADNGSLAYIPINPPARELVWVNLDGTAEPVPLDSKSFHSPRLSRDGQSLVVMIDDRPWSLDLRRNILQPSVLESVAIPLLSPDGSQAVTNSWEALHLVSTDGKSGPDPITVRGVIPNPVSWSPDGKYVVYIREDPVTRNDIWLVLMEEERKSRLFRGTNANEIQATVSPDGKWIAYRSDHSGRNEIYVEPFPDGGPIIQISSQGGTEPIWAVNGQELFYRNEEEMLVVGIETRPEFRAVKPSRLFSGIYDLAEPPHRAQNYDVAPDGRFLMIRQSEGASPIQINVVLNWPEELKRLVPVPSKPG